MLFRCLRDTGMPITEMCRYADLVREGDHTVGERQALLERHAGRVQERMHLLERQYVHLLAKIRAYDSHGRPR